MKIPYYLLGLLIRYGPQHGYQLKQIIGRQIAEFARIKLPTIYYHLERMEQKGLVSASVEREGNRPERTVYAITDQGRAYFDQLLGQLLMEEYSPEFGIDGVLFFGEAVDPEKLREQLALKEQELRKRYKALKRHQKSLFPAENEKAALFTRLIFTHHRRHLEAEIEWIESVLKRLPT
ncbi:MAG: PadR family transcriptional regulator [Firmicutes bacterium]|nr:PadR family transcriptional regulator [Bacillota bacterium]